MKTIFIVPCLALVISACHNSNTADKNIQKDTTIVASASTTSVNSGNSSMPDSMAMQKNIKDYMTPGKEHQMIASWSGNWLGEATFWMKEGATPLKANFTIVNKMELGGRYQQSSLKTNLGGMPFEGMSTLGYDNAKKDFISTWIDNMGTGIIMMEGTWNETTKCLTLSGMETDPATGKEKNLRETIRVIDNDRQVTEMFEAEPGAKEFKTMEIFYTRKK